MLIFFTSHDQERRLEIENKTPRGAAIMEFLAHD
jgi:hypothetical protein